MGRAGWSAEINQQIPWRWAQQIRTEHKPFRIQYIWARFGKPLISLGPRWTNYPCPSTRTNIAYLQSNKWMDPSSGCGHSGKSWQEKWRCKKRTSGCEKGKVTEGLRS